MTSPTPSEPIITIISGTPAHAQELAHLHKKVFVATYPHFPQVHTTEEDVSHFAHLLSSETVFVAQHNDTIVGFISFSPTSINKLYIDPSFQKIGIGTRLLDTAKEHSDQFTLWTFQENTKARAFYEKHGFKAVMHTDGSQNEERQPDMLYQWHRNES